MHAPRRSAAIMVAALCACGGHGAKPDASVEPDAAQQPYFLAPVTYPAAAMASAVAVGDVDGDGKLDLVVVGGRQTGSVAVLLGLGGGVFGTATSFAAGKIPSAITVADFDGDGHDD